MALATHALACANVPWVGVERTALTQYVQKIAACMASAPSLGNAHVTHHGRATSVVIFLWMLL
jgi:hypothetical protein